MFEDFDTYEFYENDLEEMGRNEAFQDAMADMRDEDEGYEGYDPYEDYCDLEDSCLDSYYESQYETFTPEWE